MVKGEGGMSFFGGRFSHPGRGFERRLQRLGSLDGIRSINQCLPCLQATCLLIRYAI